MKVKEDSKKDWKILSLPKVEDNRGSLTVIENNKNIPFKIKRVFYLYSVPNGASRGAHAHKKLHQFLIPIAGSFKVTVSNIKDEETILLNKPWEGIYIPPMIWASESDFKKNSVCLVLASDIYEENDYYREYSDYVNASTNS